MSDRKASLELLEQRLLTTVDRAFSQYMKLSDEHPVPTSLVTLLVKSHEAILRSIKALGVGDDDSPMTDEETLIKLRQATERLQAKLEQKAHLDS